MAVDTNFLVTNKNSLKPLKKPKLNKAWKFG